MGTPQIPNEKPAEGSDSPVSIKDVPKIGPLLWLLLAALLIPPAVISLMGRYGLIVSHQKLWVLLLGIPIPVILLTLPRKYLLEDNELKIIGFFYRLRIPFESIRSLSPISTGRALVHPGSIFCTNPGRALKLERSKGSTLIISPRDPGPFLARFGPQGFKRGREP